MIKKNNFGFTLIELLVVISIIGILVAVSIFGLSGVRESSRDARRKADLELIRGGLEIYKADCNAYPASITFGSNLVGSGGAAAVCSSSNYYINSIPLDPIPAARNYVYRTTATGYELCAALEQGSGSVVCGSSCGASCNYKITNP
jgi:prepilin-type N-terminal cleavage/methylation domain-containing protein